jgi:hypothetical protein
VVGLTRLLSAAASADPSASGRTGLTGAARPWRQAAGVALCVALAALVLRQPWAAIWAKALADPFFHSTSAGAALTVLGFVALACARLMIWQGAIAARTQRVAACTLVVAVFAGQAANLLAHLDLVRGLGLPVNVALYHWVGDTNTYSYLLHSHSGKVAVDWLLSGLLTKLAPSYDIGRAMAQAVPAWTAPVCALAMAAAGAATLVLLPALATGPRPVARQLLFGFCALACIKTVADGGPLTYHFGPAALVMLAMLRPSLGARPISRRGAAVVSIGALLAYIALWASVSDEPGWDAILSFGATLAVLGLLCWATWPAAQRRRRAGAAFGLGCGAVVAASVLGSVVATPLALWVPLPDDTEATLCDLHTLQCRQEAVGGQHAIDVYRRAGDDPLKPHHTFIAPAGSVGPSQLTAVIHPLRTVAPRADAPTLVQVLPGQRVGPTANRAVALQSTELPTLLNAAPTPFSTRNYHVFMHVAAAQLRAQGLQEFALVPVLRQADADALGLAHAH